MCSGKGCCPCPHHKIISVLITLFGLLFLLGAMEIFSETTVGFVWPVLVIIAGLFKMTSNKCKCC